MALKDTRLAKKRDFDLLLKYGRWANGQFLDAKYLELVKIRNFVPKKEDGDKFVLQLRIAYAVGLKISKKAVERNRLKRQLREAIRLLEKGFGLKTGFYILFTPKKTLLGKNFAEISDETKVLLKKIKII